MNTKAAVRTARGASSTRLRLVEGLTVVALGVLVLLLLLSLVLLTVVVVAAVAVGRLLVLF